MGATNKEGGNSEFYKLKEDKDDKSPNKGRLMFFKQEKINGVWASGSVYNTMVGNLKGLEVKTYMYEGKPKESLTMQFVDKDGVNCYVQVGLGSSVSSNLLNAFAGEALLGEITIETGKPKEFNGKTYPTIYVKNDGQNAKWKYNKTDDTWKQIPIIQSVTDDDGNTIKKGVKANTEFWKKVIDDINKKLGTDMPNPNEKSSNPKPKENVDFDAERDLPF